MTNPSIPCPICRKPLKFVFQEAQHVNLPTVSMVIMEHTTATCPGCARVFMPVMSAPALSCVGLRELKPKSGIEIASTLPAARPLGSA